MNQADDHRSQGISAGGGQRPEHGGIQLGDQAINYICIVNPAKLGRPADRDCVHTPASTCPGPGKSPTDTRVTTSERTGNRPHAALQWRAPTAGGLGQVSTLDL